MLMKIFTSVAALAMLAGVAGAQSSVGLTPGAPLGAGANDSKQVVGERADQRMIGGRSFERRAARIPHDRGRLLASDPYSDEKVVINRRAGERVSDLRGDGTFRGQADMLSPGAPLGLDPYSGEKRTVGGAR